MKKSAIKCLVITLLAGAIAICAVPAQATTFTFQDEYWLKSGTAYSTVFSGATGSAPTSGIYQETTTGASPVITQLTTTITLSSFQTTPVPGEFTQNGGGSALQLNGWSANLDFIGSTAHISNSPWYKPGTGVQSPSGNLSGTGLNFEYLTGASANHTTGVISGTQGVFTLNSIFLDTSASATSLTIEGLLHGIVVDTTGSHPVSVNGSTGMTFSPGWAGIDEVVFTGDNLGNNVLTLDDINVSPVPEPGSLSLFAAGLLSLAGLIRRKLCR